ncbi:MAG: hypothetical protein NW226_10465 [Microscillaceae bacterium]|nr:hypothetical protein [Microscillaceae bacterium]
MKKIILSSVFLCLAVVQINAQQASKSQKVEEGQVPEVIKTNFQEQWGFPVDYWAKMTLSNAQSRYVAVFTAMDQSSGKTLERRIRYTEDGRQTSSTQYLGNGEGEEADFLKVYLGTGGVSDAVYEKFEKLLKENTLIRMESFTFFPGNQTEESIQVFRFLFKDKKGQKAAYFDRDMNKFEMSRYPVRFEEAAEMD